jgi:signal transduction histidine kinase
LPDGKGPMAVDDLPATATLTSVRFAERPYVRMWSLDGKSEDWSLERYLRESTLGVDEQQNQARFQNIREFSLSIAHELKTPLTAMRSAGQNLADGIVDAPERVRTYGALIEREGRRLTEMVGRVLTFAGIQSQLGSALSDANTEASTRQATLTQAQNLNSSASGVNLNDETLKLTQFQQAFQASILSDDRKRGDSVRFHQVQSESGEFPRPDGGVVQYPARG